VTCRRAALALLLGAASGASRADASRADASRADAVARRWRIVVVLDRPEGANESSLRAWLAARHLDAEYIVRQVAADPAQVTPVVRAARAHGADLIYVAGPALLRQLAPVDGRDGAVTDIPLVFTGLVEPQDVAHQRNLTGVSCAIPIARQFDTMLAYRPFERIGVLVNPADPTAAARLDTLQRHALARGIVLLERQLPLDGRGQPIAAAVPELAAALARQNAQLLYLGDDAWVRANAPFVTLAALTQRLPSFAVDEQTLVDSHALFGIAGRADTVGRLAARQILAILRERALPAALPVAAVARPACMLNLAVAASLGLYPPLRLLNSATILRS
jgi:putative ABC transport system substrate-binding protein